MSVSSVSSSSSTSSLYNSSNVVSGLASGIDTEAMIESSVAPIQTKIDNLLKQQQTLLWKQEAYQSITDKMVALSNKYTSYTSNSNLLSPSFFSASVITPTGDYSKYISASGSTSSDIQILGVSQLATTATYAVAGSTISDKISDTITATKSIDLGGKTKVSNVAGKALTFSYGNTSATIYLSSDKEYNSAQDIADEINEQLANATVTATNGDTIKLSEKITATADGDKLTLSVGANESNSVKIADSSSDSLLKALNISAGTTLSKTGNTSVTSTVGDLYTEDKNTKDVLAGTYFNVTYNGTTTKISMPTADSAEYEEIFGGNKTEAERDKAMVNYLQQQLDNAFGYNRVKVGNANEGTTNSGLKLTFLATDGNPLSIDSGSTDVIGTSGILGITAGASNRVNTSQTLGDLLGTTTNTASDGTVTTTLNDMVAATDSDGKILTDDNGNVLYNFTINGVTIGQYSADTKLSTIMSDINNNSDAGVKVSYSKTADQFVFTSTHGGAGGKIQIGDASSDSIDPNADLATRLFGARDEKGDFTNKAVDEWGTDAQMTVTINGVQKTLTSGTNTFDIDGFKVSAKGVFAAGQDSDGNIETTDGSIINLKKGTITKTVSDTDGATTTTTSALTADDLKNINYTAAEGVSFDFSVDVDKIVDAVKSFVEDYNAMLDEINTQYTTKPDDDYEPLTDDEKAELSDSQIEAWEEKAKEGLLFGDSDLSSLSNSLRFLFSSSSMSNIGINVSTSYSDKGKISLDETTLRSALASDPESVKTAFTAAADESNSSSGGVMTRLKTVLDKYAATTGSSKGILINKAGSKYSSLSLLSNSIQTQLDSIDDRLDTLYDQLEDKIDFYTQKWSRFETLVSQLNSQSSYLSSLMGTSY